jgi:hypothetical protein
VKIIVGTIHELSLQEFGGYAHLMTTRCLFIAIATTIQHENEVRTGIRASKSAFEICKDQSNNSRIGVAETKYEFRCRDVPWNVSTRVWRSSKIIFIPQISNAEFPIEMLYDSVGLETET